MKMGHAFALGMIAFGGMLSVLLWSPWPFVGLGALAVVVGCLAGDWGHAKRACDYAEALGDLPPDLPTQPLEIGTALHQHIEAYQQSLEMDAQPSEKVPEEP